MNKHVKKLVIALALASPALGAFATDSAAKTLSVYTTAKDTDQKLSLGEPLSFTPATQNPETDIAIYVNPNNTYQTFLGFGGAVTDASAETYAKLSRKKQKAKSKKNLLTPITTKKTASATACCAPPFTARILPAAATLTSTKAIRN